MGGSCRQSWETCSDNLSIFLRIFGIIVTTWTGFSTIMDKWCELGYALIPHRTCPNYIELCTTRFRCTSFDESTWLTLSRIHDRSWTYQIKRNTCSRTRRTGCWISTIDQWWIQWNRRFSKVDLEEQATLLLCLPSNGIPLQCAERHFLPSLVDRVFFWTGLVVWAFSLSLLWLSANVSVQFLESQISFS